MIGGAWWQGRVMTKRPAALGSSGARTYLRKSLNSLIVVSPSYVILSLRSHRSQLAAGSW
jgi:hypothetical protein